MPNGTTHRLTGMVVGFTTPLLLDKNKKYSAVELTTYTFTGFRLGCLPDILEPALHPNHRKFFHSATIGLFLGYGGYKIWKEIEKKNVESKVEGFDWEGFILMLFLTIIAVYLAHLYLDGLTKKGLPLI